VTTARPRVARHPRRACCDHIAASPAGQTAQGGWALPRAAGLPYEVCGDGPPVVLVPGLALDRWFWRPLWRRMAGFAFYSVDMPRFTAGTVEAVAAGLADWHAAVGLPPCPWVGHSLGGQVVVHVATARPSPASAAVLVAPSVPASFTGYRLAVLARGLLREPAALWWQILRGVAVHGLADPARAVAAGRADGAFWDLEGRIRAPSLVVYGEQDVYIPARRLVAVARAIPGARRHVIPDAHHTVLYTHPAELAAAVGGFLAEVARRPARAAR
jgi:pimeloyl-ACP methyl ester carboxylesterase